MLSYFTDAVLRAPTIGCMLMCFSAALIGVIVFLRKQSLVGESLSHAAYPGVVIGIMVAGALAINDEQELVLSLIVLGGAFVSAFVGLLAIVFLERFLGVRNDSALCFVLSAFFGIGLTLASQVQFAYSGLYRQIQVYLFGQAATMTDVHIFIYGALAIAISVVVILFYKEIYVMTFDRDYARSIGINTGGIDLLVFFLIVVAVVVGIRSVGVVLMSAMLIAPAVSARQYTNKLYLIFIFAGGFGLLSGFFGNYLSVEMTHTMRFDALDRMAIPTGPMIVVVAAFMCLVSLMFAPERGVVIRLIRVMRFRYHCMCENILKVLWRYGNEKEITFAEIVKYQRSSFAYVRFILSCLGYYGWIKSTPRGYRLTPLGEQYAARIVRLHRLWEVYLVDYLGVGTERVHHSAEEMEHIITPEIEKELTQLLKNPKYDPHHQPIPG